MKKYAIHDGPGIRLTIFLKGCPLRCWWCHNPESQQQQMEMAEKCIALDSEKKVWEEEIVGRLVSVDEVMQEIRKEVLFFDESGGGVTFSGGEPLMQPHFLHALLTSCNAEEIHTAVDTTGYAAPDMLRSLMNAVDLFLYDVKIIDDDLHQRYTGVSNRIILDNLRVLSQHEKKIVLRCPIIPGMTDTPQNVADIIDLMKGLHTIPYIHLLPFHRIADGKYQRFQKENKMCGRTPPSDERMQTLKQMFEQHGIHANIGG